MNSPPNERKFLSDSVIRASLKQMPAWLIWGMQRTEIAAVFKRRSAFTRQELKVLAFWLSFMRQRSAGGDVGGDERAQKEGEAVFADLAEFSSLLSRSGECSAAPFDCCLLNLLLYNEPVYFQIHVQNAEGESIISVLGGVGWAIPLYTLPNQVLVDVFTTMNSQHWAVTVPVWVAFVTFQMLCPFYKGKAEKWQNRMLWKLKSHSKAVKFSVWSFLCQALYLCIVLRLLYFTWIFPFCWIIFQHHIS